MKKSSFIPMMALVALLAPSPPAFAAPDTGPKVDNVEVFSSSASADLIMPEEGVFQVSITNNYFSAPAQASGQETVLHRSDHSVVTTHYILNEKVFLGSESNKLVIVDKYDGAHLQTWFDGRPCTGNMQVNIGVNFKENVIGVASMAALRSHQLVWMMKRPPAWPIRSLRG